MRTSDNAISRIRPGFRAFMCGLNDEGLELLGGGQREETEYTSFIMCWLYMNKYYLIFADTEEDDIVWKGLYSAPSKRGVGVNIRNVFRFVCNLADRCNTRLLLNPIPFELQNDEDKENPVFQNEPPLIVETDEEKIIKLKENYIKIEPSLKSCTFNGDVPHGLIYIPQ